MTPLSTSTTSTSITIGEVPDDVRDELAARAALSGRSLEEYLRDELIALASRPSAALWISRVRARKDALESREAVPVCLGQSQGQSQRDVG